jgi:hypothetical protein
VTEERVQGDEVLSSRHRRVQSPRATFRVDETGARTTPQLVAIVGGMAALATGSFWATVFTGPQVTRSTRAVARPTAQARTAARRWFDGMDTGLGLVMLITPLRTA